MIELTLLCILLYLLVAQGLLIHCSRELPDDWIAMLMCVIWPAVLVVGLWAMLLPSERESLRLIVRRR